MQPLDRQRRLPLLAVAMQQDLANDDRACQAACLLTQRFTQHNKFAIYAHLGSDTMKPCC